MTPSRARPGVSQANRNRRKHIAGRSAVQADGTLRVPAVTFVIMAGGKGERLWPLVRSTMPKVCLSPDGTRSLLQATIDRLQPAWPGASWLIVTTQEQAAAVRRSLSPSLRRQVLVEPKIKNTAACIALAAVALATR